MATLSGWSQTAGRVWTYLEWGFPLILGLLMVSLWLNRFGLLPDSTFYLSAATNLLERGKFVVYTNFPSFDFEPVMEIYSEYPPGFPLYLAPFVFLLGDPLLAAATAQAVAILGIFVIAVPLFRTLEFDPVLRLCGYFFLGFFISFREIFGTLYSEPLFLLVTLGTLLYAVRALLDGGSGKWNWILGGALLAVGTSVKFIGVFNLVFWIVPLSVVRTRRWTKTVTMPLAAGLPAGIWLVRNYLLFQKATRSHLEDWSQDPRNILDPFRRAYALIACDRVLLAVLLGLIVLLPIGLFLFRKSRGLHVAPHFTLLLGSVTHLLGIAILSTVFRMDFLDHRLLSPSYLLIGISLLSGVSLLVRFRPPHTRTLWALPLLYLAFNPAFRTPVPQFNLDHFERPPEQALWEDLGDRQGLGESSHFYTSINFLHQIFCDRPHKIVWNENYVDTAEKTGWLLHYGSHPFFVLNEGDPMIPFLEEQKGSLGLTREESGPFTLFRPDTPPEKSSPEQLPKETVVTPN
ncbi:MAG: hypothetical protein KC931_15245 [Candidatus Omnitrophica bacterium]|nr:hypothetical protein [Candidatus Omnitrophota bacterium]